MKAYETFIVSEGKVAKLKVPGICPVAVGKLLVKAQPSRSVGLIVRQ
jgi:hypothetical protein